MIAVRVTIDVVDTPQGTLERPGEQSLVNIHRFETVIPAKLGETAEDASGLLMLTQSKLERLCRESHDAAQEQVGEALQALEGAE